MIQQKQTIWTAQRTLSQSKETSGRQGDTRTLVLEDEKGLTG